MAEMRKLELYGSPFERGKKHGEEFEQEIKENLQNYIELFKYYGATEEEIYDQVDEFVRIIGEENEEYMREMEGVSEGSGLSIEDITILNARYELIYLAWKEEAEHAAGDNEKEAIKVEGCTTFGVTPEGTSTDDEYLAQSWGWKPWVNVFLMDIKRDNGPDMIAMTEAGIVGGKIGVNEEGVGIVLNGIATENDGEEIFRRPYHVRFREMLDAKTLDKSIASLITQNRACSANIMAGQPQVGIVDIEAGPEKVNYLYPESGVLTHTNHIKGDSLNSELEKVFPDTITRGMRIEQLVSEQAGSLNVDNTKEILRDEVCSPSSICRSVDNSLPEEEQVKTMGSFVIDLSNKVIHAAAGRPTKNEYQRHEIKGS
jgi:isopenicillin-N N-acyltransferase-like protein